MDKTIKTKIKEKIKLPSSVKLCLDEIKEDIQVIKERDPAAKSTLEVVLTYSGLHAVLAYRVSHALYKKDHFLAARIVSSPADLVIVGGGDEGVGDDLVITHAAAGGAQMLLHQLLGVVAAAGGLTGHQRAGDVVVAVETGHFLCQIGVVHHVGTPGGNGDGLAVHAEAQLGEDLLHLSHGNVGAQQSVDLLGAQLQHGGMGHIVQNVDHAVHNLAGAQHLHQFAGAVDGLEGVLAVQTGFTASPNASGSLTAVNPAEAISSNVRYFASSSLGASPIEFTDETSGATLIGPANGEVHPFRVTDPVLWALHETSPALIPSAAC